LLQVLHLEQSAEEESVVCFDDLIVEILVHLHEVVLKVNFGLDFLDRLPQSNANYLKPSVLSLQRLPVREDVNVDARLIYARLSEVIEEVGLCVFLADYKILESLAVFT